MLNYRFPLDDAMAEVIVVPFHDPVLSHMCAPSIVASGSIKAKCEASWCYTSVHWEAVGNGLGVLDIKVPASFSVDGFDTLLLVVNLPKGSSIQVSLQYPIVKNFLSRWSTPVYGCGVRMEVAVPLHELYVSGAFRYLHNKKVTNLLFRICCGKVELGSAHFSWVGLRHSATNNAISKHRLRRSCAWDSWVLPENSWGAFAFEQGLLFSAEDFLSVRAKKSNPIWLAHFAYLEEHAKKYLKRNPEEDYGIYLPNHDKRYIRVADQNKTAYHWEALVLAFVGLVNEDKFMIKHALRYLMCMIHTRYWTDSMEQRSPSSTWNQRSFMEEMTAVSVALLADWLSFALSPHTKQLIIHALWDRGIAPVRRDLLQFDYMHNMNQGIVFNRACIIGGLYIEKHWPRIQCFVDSAYEEMKGNIKRYVQNDGGVVEGPGYFCMAVSGAVWAIIAYCRARDIDWREEVRAIFSSSVEYVEAISSTEKVGTVIPIGDCRTNWLGGDVVPIFASLFPNTVFSAILAPCLLSGSVFALTGTLSKSGGMLGMVYGPSNPEEQRTVVPSFIQLAESAIVSILRANSTFRTRLLLMGCPKSKSHSHRDVGNFVLEVNGHSIFCDRGMIDYWHAEANYLSKSAFHNTITPIVENSYLDQEFADRPIVPAVKVDGDQFYAEIDVCPVWKNQMVEYVRCLQSDNVDVFEITDRIVMQKSSRVAFHVNSRYIMKAKGKDVIVDVGSFLCTLTFPWAVDFKISTDNFSFDFKPIYRLSVISGVSVNHELQSVIRLEAKN